MTEEEMRLFEQRAPTTLPQERPSHRSWDGELLYAAELGDIPRMARALDHGARPKALDKYKNSVATLYASGTNDDANDMRCHFASSGIDQNQAWAWLKARGVLTTEDWNFFYRNLASHADPVEAKCVEVNLWALWKNISDEERQRVLSYLDTLFSQIFPQNESTDPVHVLGDPFASSIMQKVMTFLDTLFSQNESTDPVHVPGDPFTSSIMQKVMTFEGIDRSVCGASLSVFNLQSRVLALSSLLGAQQGLPLENHFGCSQDYMKLGLWAYAPDTVVQDLLSLPFYRPLLIDCITQAIATLQVFYEAQKPSDSDAHDALLLARRLARGTQALIRHGVEFPPETLKALLVVPEMRPFIEKVLLKATLDERGSETHAQTSSRSRVRL